MLGLLHFLDFIKPVFGVVIDGNVPSIVLAGLLFSLVLQKLKTYPRRFLITATMIGIVALMLGFVLRNWFIISKIQGTPSWAMVCNGISVLLFVVLFILIDLKKKTNWTGLFKMAGQNSLTTYLAPDILYYSIWLSGVPVLFYKNSEHSLLVIVGSLFWSAAMVLFANVLTRWGIRLKL
jgi:predicted acyltransferase